LSSIVKFSVVERLHELSSKERGKDHRRFVRNIGIHPVVAQRLARAPYAARCGILPASQLHLEVKFYPTMRNKAEQMHLRRNRNADACFQPHRQSRVHDPLIAQVHPIDAHCGVEQVSNLLVTSTASNPVELSCAQPPSIAIPPGNGEHGRSHLAKTSSNSHRCSSLRRAWLAKYCLSPIVRGGRGGRRAPGTPNIP